MVQRTAIAREPEGRVARPVQSSGKTGHGDGGKCCRRGGRSFDWWLSVGKVGPFTRSGCCVEAGLSVGADGAGSIRRARSSRSTREVTPLPEM